MLLGFNMPSKNSKTKGTSVDSTRNPSFPMSAILFRLSRKLTKEKSPIVPEQVVPAQAPEIKRTTVDISHDENHSLCEICLWTQQSLERHVKMVRKENFHLAIEPNYVHNTDRQALLVAEEDKKCSWLLLQKFYTRDQLKSKGFEKMYRNIDAFETDRRHRDTPVLPARTSSTDLLFLEPHVMLEPEF